MTDKLEQLTDEQAALMEVVKNNWLDLFFKGKNLDKVEAEKGIKWLYSFSKLDEPMVIFVDSPLAAQYAANMLKKVFYVNQVRDQVGEHVQNQVQNQVWNQLRDQVRNQVGNQVRNQVGNQVWNQLRDQVWNQVWNQILDQVRDQKLEYFSFSSYGSVSDFCWLSFYDFFDQIGIDFGKAKGDFKKFVALIETGIYDMIQLKGVCIVCSYPKAVRRNQQNMLHDSKLPSIEWADGYKLFHLNGVRFDEVLFERVVSRQMSLEEVLKIEDIDQRKQAMRFVNVWDFIKEAKGKQIDTYTKIGAKDGRKVHYWLYEFPANPDLFPKGAKYAIYEDSMVGKAEYHMQGVLMEHNTVPEAFAWKQSDDLFTLSPAEWEALELDVDFT